MLGTKDTGMNKQAGLCLQGTCYCCDEEGTVQNRTHRRLGAWGQKGLHKQIRVLTCCPEDEWGLSRCGSWVSLL